MEFNMETDGIDEMTDSLQDLADTAEELDGENEVSFEELFTNSFMRKYTTFDSIDELFDESPWTVEDEDDFDAIPEADLDNYVNEHTRFPDWEEMIGTAAEQWTLDQLGL